MTYAALCFAFLAGALFEMAIVSLWLGVEWRFDATLAATAAALALLMVAL